VAFGDRRSSNSETDIVYETPPPVQQATRERPAQQQQQPQPEKIPINLKVLLASEQTKNPYIATFWRGFLDTDVGGALIFATMLLTALTPFVQHF